MLRSLMITVGFAVGLLAATTIGPAPAAAEGTDCTKSCVCQDGCNKKWQACDATCAKKPAAEQDACKVACNDKLLKCAGKCPHPECACGGY
jgi:hypothetical protein